MQGTSYKLCGKACSVKKLPLTLNGFVSGGEIEAEMLNPPLNLN